jgi:hypothetical protein
VDVSSPDWDGRATQQRQMFFSLGVKVPMWPRKGEEEGSDRSGIEKSRYKNSMLRPSIAMKEEDAIFCRRRCYL